MSVQPIILAAGKGTRMNNPDLPKPLVLLKGRPMVSYVLDTVEKAEFLPAALVVGYLKEKVSQTLGDGYTYVAQDEQLGTGHAVAVCEEQLAGTADCFLIVCGDMPLLKPETLKKVVEVHDESRAVLSLATLRTDRPDFNSFGRIIRDTEGNIKAIREYKDATEEERAINEYNPGIYCFSDSWVWDALRKVDRVNAQGEYYLTDLLAIAVAEGEKIASVEMTSWQETLGINSPEQLEEAAKWV
ncbi:MAG: NTP transferase domain-containing protein [bacterium]